MNRKVRYIDSQTDRQTVSQSDRQTDRQADRQIETRKAEQLPVPSFMLWLQLNIATNRLKYLILRNVKNEVLTICKSYRLFTGDGAERNAAPLVTVLVACFTFLFQLH